MTIYLVFSKSDGPEALRFLFSSQEAAQEQVAKSKLAYPQTEWYWRETLLDGPYLERRPQA